MSSATTDAAAENAPPSVAAAANDAETMCAAAPNHTHTPTHPPVHTPTRPHPLLVCSAELRAQLATNAEQLATNAEQLATKDEQIDALTEQLNVKLNIKTGPKIVGVYTNEHVTIMRAVYQGTGKAYFTYNPGGTSKKYLKSTDDDNWVFEEEEVVLARVAAHEATMGALKSSSPAK
jgi:hypothetical protein